MVDSNEPQPGDDKNQEQPAATAEGGTQRRTANGVTTSRAGRVGATSRLQRRTGVELDAEGRPVRPASSTKGKMSAKTAKRLTIASYSVVGLVILIIGGHKVLTEMGVIGGEQPPPQLDPIGDQLTPDQRWIQAQLAEARRAKHAADNHFQNAMKAAEDEETEAFVVQAAAFMRHYWQAKYYIAAASHRNMTIDPSVDRYEERRNDYSAMLRDLSQKLGTLNQRVNRLGVAEELAANEHVARAQRSAEQIEQKITQMRMDAGDASVSVDYYLDEADNYLEQVRSILSTIDDSEDLAGDADKLFRAAYRAMELTYRAVAAEPALWTDQEQENQARMLADMQRVAEMEGTPSPDDAAYDEERRAYEEARDAAGV